MKYANRLSRSVSAVLVFMCCICGCHSDDRVNESSALQTSVSESSENTYWIGRERERDLFLELSSQYKNKLNEGKEKYHIDAAKDEFDVYLTFDPEEFYEVSNGEDYFDLNALFEKYNWKEITDSGNHDLGLGGNPKDGRTYSYEYSDLTILLNMQFEELPDNVKVLRAFSYSFVKTDDLGQPYYSFIEENYAPSNNAVCDMGTTQKAECLIDKEFNVYTSRDICVLLSAVISWVDVKPEASPFLYLDVPHPMQSVEYRQALGFDLFEMLDLGSDPSPIEKEDLLYKEMTPQYKASLTDGLNVYRIKASEREFDIFLSFDPSEYEYEEENKGFDLESLLKDYGWSEDVSEGLTYDFGWKDDLSKTGRTFYFESGDYAVDLKLQYLKIGDEMTFSGFMYSFVDAEDRSESYYRYTEKSHAPTNDVFCNMGTTQKRDILIDKEYGVYTSEDVCYLLAYVISWIEIKPEVSPFSCIDVDYDDGSPEIRKKLQYDEVVLLDVHEKDFDEE